MKRLAFVAGAIFMLSLASCKKDYTCTCVTSVDGFDDVTTTVEYTDVKKSDAEESCDTLDSASESTTCTLD